MKEIKKYAQGKLLLVKHKLSTKDKKILHNFIIFCRGTASEIKVKNFERKLLVIRDVSQIEFDKWNLEKLREFLAKLNKSELAEATKNDIKKILKRFLKESYEDWTKRFKGLKDIKGNKEINPERVNANTILNGDEVEKVIRKAESLRFKALIMVLYETGARPSEVLTTKWKDINLDKKEIKLVSTKNKTVRINTVKESIIHLKRYKQEYPYPDVVSNDFVFPSPRERKKSLSLTYFGDYFGKLTKKAVGRKLFPYILRHTRATELQKVLPPKIYEKVMDHSIEMATRYSHLNKDDVKEAMEKFVYHIEEITEKERDEIKELKKQVKDFETKYKPLLDSQIALEESQRELEKENKKLQRFLPKNI